MDTQARSVSILALAGVGLAALPLAPALAAPLPRPAGFAQCGVCHKVNAGEKPTIGPNLWQVNGRKSGTSAGYVYSAAMKKANITWNKATLTTYLAAPQKVVPGTKMAFAGIRDPKVMAQVTDYVLSLR